MSGWDVGWVGLFEIRDSWQHRIIKDKTLLINLVETDDVIMYVHKSGHLHAYIYVQDLHSPFPSCPP